MAAARSVSAEPAVEMSCAVQSSEKSRFRKTANIDGAAGTDAAVIGPPTAPRAPNPHGDPGRPRSTPRPRPFARSLAFATRHCDPLAQQQGFLTRTLSIAVDPAGPAVSAERPVPSDDPVARDHQRYRITHQCPADGASRARRPDALGDVAIARGRSRPDPA